MDRLKWILLFLFLFPSGCALYKKPCVNVPLKWPKKYAIQTPKAVHLPSLLWWKQFKNPELNGLIQKAVQNNYQTNLAIANIEAAHYQLQEIKLNYLPNVSVLTGFSQFPVLGNPGAMIIFYPAYIANIFQLYKQQQSASAKLSASIYAKYSANLMVIAQTSAAFFTLTAQKEALRLNEVLLKQTHVYLKLLQSQYKASLIALDDIIKIKRTLNEIEAQIEIIQHNIVISENTLHFLMNENPGEMHLSTLFNEINQNKLVPANLPVSVLRSRPDICEAEFLLQSAHAEIGVSATNLLPSVNLGAYLGTGSTAGKISLGQAYLNTPLVNLPVFADINVSKSKYKAQYIKYVTTIREALREVSNALSAYDAASQQLKHYQAALKEENRLCGMNASRYRQGIEDNLSLTQCRMRLTGFRLVVNRSKLKKLLALTTLYTTLGGGYEGA